MSIDAISQVIGEMSDVGAAASSGAAPASFSQRLQAEFEAVNSKLVGAETELQQLAAGKTTDLHHVMLAMEDARLSFQLLVQVRNKVLEAYQDVMRMQV